MTHTILLGIILAFSRILIGLNFEPEHFTWLSAYKDTAHLFIASLGTCWWFQKHKWQWNLFWFLNIVEVATAIYSRM